jgi:serine phosphatase RsbU (regulator of sigma subunit)/fumarate reductase subunit D
MKNIGCHCNATPWQHPQKLIKFWLLACTMLAHVHTWAQTPLEVGPNTTVFFADKLNSLVWEDKTGTATPEQALKRLQDFQPADTVSDIQPTSHYWVAQRLINRLGEDREIVVNAFVNKEGIHWLKYQHFVMDAKGHAKELNGPYSANIPLHMNDIDPSVFTMDTTLSRSPVFTLPKNEEVLLLSRLKSSSTFPASNFNLQLYDRATYLELRKYGLYIEGLLAGLILALVLSSSSSLFFKRDIVSIVYSTWLISGFLQIIMLPIQDGQRLFELLFDQQPGTIGVMPSNVFWMGLVSYLQLIMFFGFGRTFLGTQRYFPKFHFLTNVFIAFEGIRFILGYFFEHELSPALFRWPAHVFFMCMLIGTLYCAVVRVKQGLRTAKFSVVFSSSVMPFWLLSILSMEGIHPLHGLTSSSATQLLSDTYVLQAIAILLGAFVSHFSIHARTRGIEKKLSASLIAQREAAENQTKLLEATVEERTRELQTQHTALNAAHKEVLDSVNYASRLQRGQLPRSARIENRFQSFATVWEPRDTIGGDLWWISASSQNKPFILAVADCTGHGVPGAMLSLLVSNSLERIYAQDSNANPAQALLSLDHYVRHGLNQDRIDSESNDGCDALLMRIDPSSKCIEFSSAKISLIQITEQGQCIRHKTQRCSLGYVETLEEAQIPQLQTLSYGNEDLFVIVTDGLTDQIGSHNGKRAAYGHRRLEALLMKHHKENATDIAKHLQEDFARWQCNEPRRDDVTVVIFKL